MNFLNSLRFFFHFCIVMNLSMVTLNVLCLILFLQKLGDQVSCRNAEPNNNLNLKLQKIYGMGFQAVFTPQPLRAVRVLFSPMVSGWADRHRGKSLSGLYLKNRKV